MIEISRMLTELENCSVEFNRGKITEKELHVKIGLILTKLEKVEISYEYQPLDTLPQRVQDSFNTLLYANRYKAIISLTELAEASGDKRSYNSKLRHIIGSRFGFKNLYRTMKINIDGYIRRNDLRFYATSYQVFIIKGENDNDSN
jgi:hypothetical protein